MRGTRSPWEPSGRQWWLGEMLPQQRCKKPHLKPTSEFHSIALKWKRDVPTAAVLGRRHWGDAVGPRHAGTPRPVPEEGWGDVVSPCCHLLPSLVPKQECLNAFYVVTQMMKGPKMGLTKMSCTLE